MAVPGKLLLQKKGVHEPRRGNDAPNISFQSPCGGQFTLSIQFCVSHSHQRSTTVSLETNPIVEFGNATLHFKKT